MARRGVVLLVSAVLVVTGLAAAADPRLPVSEFELKAEYIWRFTLFVDWPPRVESDDDTPFVIGVVGDSPLRRHLERRTAGESLGGKPVVVRAITELARASECQILFIADTARWDLETILAVTADRPVLTVADRDGFAERGVLINLFVVDDRVRFEINQAAVRRSGLVFRSKLYKVARIISAEGGP